MCLNAVGGFQTSIHAGRAIVGKAPDDQHETQQRDQRIADLVAALAHRGDQPRAQTRAGSSAYGRRGTARGPGSSPAIPRCPPQARISEVSRNHLKAHRPQCAKSARAGTPRRSDSVYRVGSSSEGPPTKRPSHVHRKAPRSPTGPAEAKKWPSLNNRRLNGKTRPYLVFNGTLARMYPGIAGQADQGHFAVRYRHRAAAGVRPGHLVPAGDAAEIAMRKDFPRG